MNFNTSLRVESWTLYSLGVLVIFCRMISRRLKLGKWRNLAVDDYLMVFALANFTGVVVCSNAVAKNGSSYLPPDVADHLTPEAKAAAVYGSILTFVLEIFELTGLWTVKACLLLLYARLTKGALLKQYKVVQFVAAFCAISYLLVMFLFVFYWCHPTYEYWTVPVKIEQCATYYHHLIFATAFNIATDLMLFFIPIPIIIRTTLPLKRKILLCFILGLGVFNILAAILNRYYNFAYPNTYMFLYWYVAEMCIGLFVGNLPLCYPLFRFFMGHRDASSTPTPPYVMTIGSERMRRRRQPTTLFSTRGGSTLWDKGDDPGAEQSTRSDHARDSRTGTSDSGSGIELVLQGHGLGHGYNTTVCSDTVQDSNETRRAEEGREPASKSSRAGDKIMVVRTVDISSSRNGGNEKEDP